MSCGGRLAERNYHHRLVFVCGAGCQRVERLAVAELVAGFEKQCTCRHQAMTLSLPARATRPSQWNQLHWEECGRCPFQPLRDIYVCVEGWASSSFYTHVLLPFFGYATEGVDVKIFQYTSQGCPLINWWDHKYPFGVVIIVLFFMMIMMKYL